MRCGTGGLTFSISVPIFVVWAAIASSGLSGCASRVVDADQPQQRSTASLPSPEAEPGYPSRRGVGLASDSRTIDDPARRVGPDGRPAPYGRDVVTGRPLSDLEPGRPVPPSASARLGQPTPAPIPPGPGGSTVVVAAGDTLFAIARRNNVNVDALMRANGLQNEKIRVGQRLTIPRG